MFIALLLVVALVSVPIINEQVLKVENLSERQRAIHRSISDIDAAAASGDSRAERDSTEALIERYSNYTDELSKTAVQLGLFRLASRGLQTALTVTDYENAIDDCNRLLQKFPNTLVAEQIFLIAAKCHIAMADMGSSPRSNFEKAIEYLERIEQNRSEAINFPKYKFVEIKPDRYYNLDRGKVVLKNRDLAKKVYTLEDVIREQATDTTQTKGELLSDAVMEIGHCLSKMGEGAKAREQYSIILDLFKESDLVDKAAKAIADSYVKEADMLDASIIRMTDSSLITETRHKRDKLYESAVDAYLKFLNVYIQSSLLSKATIALGGVYFKLGRNEEAYTTFAKAISSIKVIEEQAKVQLDIGNYYFGEKKWDDAIENYAKVLQNYSGTEFASNAQYLLGECHEAKGDTVSAIKAYETVIEEFRSSKFFPAAASKLATFYMDSKDYARAQQLLRQSVSRFPESNVAAQSQYRIGIIYVQLADADSVKGVSKEQLDIKYRLAIKEFETVVGQYDKAYEWVEKSILEMGKCHMKIGNKDDARKTLDNLSSQQMMVEKYRILGVAGSDSSIVSDFYDQLSKLTDPQAKAVQYIEIGRRLAGEELNLLDSAIAVYRTAISIAKDSVTIMTAYGEMGSVYVQKGEYRKGRRLFQDEVLNNSRCDAQRREQFEFKVADTYFRDKTFDEAIKVLAAYVDRYPDNTLFAPPSLFMLGKSRSMIGDHDGAMREYQRLFDRFPDAKDLIDNAVLAYAEALQGNDEPIEAKDFVLSFVKKNPGTAAMPAHYFKVAELYRMALSRPDSAAYFYEKVLNFPDHYLFSAAAYNLGKLRVAEGRDNDAIEAYAKVKRDDVEYFRVAQGEIGSIKGKTDPVGAIKNYEDIELTSPDVDDKILSRIGIADVYAAQKNYKEAAASYMMVVEKYVETKTDLREVAIVKLIDVLNNDGRYNDIISWADRMIREFPSSKFILNAYYFKANSLSMLKKYNEARDVFKLVMEKDTVGTLAEISQYQRAECLVSMQDGVSAVKEMNLFIQKYPKSQLVANALFSIANYEYGLENYSKAKPIYIRILAEYPAFAAFCWVKNYLAFSYNKEGSWRKAKSIYEEVRGSSCDKDAKNFAKEQIQAINVQN